MPKYYAVKKGKNPGIYTTWEECEKEVKGYPSAVFKSFESYEKAELYMKDNNTSQRLKEVFYYGVLNGYKPGVYSSWEEASKQVVGYSGANYKKFSTLEEAKAYVVSTKEKQEKIIKEEQFFSADKEEITGTPTRLLTERISYQNENKKWKLFTFQVEKAKQIRVSGIFDNDFEIGKAYTLYGKSTTYQGKESFQVDNYRWKKPESENAIISYLKTLKGLKSKAEVIYATFKDESIDVLKYYPEEVSKKIKGIGIKSAKKWQEQLLAQSSREDTMKTLFGFGLSENYVYRLIEELGEESVTIIKNNPYQLIELLHGVGFKRCDEIALQSGIALNDFHRIKECILYVIKENEENGHCYIGEEQLLLNTKKYLTIELNMVEMEAILNTKTMVVNKYRYQFPIDLNKLQESFITKTPYILTSIEIEEIESCLKALLEEELLIKEEEAIYLKAMYEAEKNVAKKILQIDANKFSMFSREKVEAVLDQVCKDLHVELEEQQKEACINFNLSNQGCYLLNGSAGTGKTFTLLMIIEISKRLYHLSDKDILAVAPTGKAAKVMEESINLPCSTIHRAIGYIKGEEVTQVLNQSFIVCDEASMLDIRLANMFLKALNDNVKLIIMGDDKQLPSIGPGNVLRDLIASTCLEKVTLNVIKRQELLSGILNNANHVIRGEMIRNGKDFSFIELDNPVKIRNYIIREYERLTKENMSFEDLVLLIPQRKGELGVDAFNYLIQKYLNPIGKNELKLAKKTLELNNQESRTIYIHKNDRVIQNKNDYQKEIYTYENGEYIETTKKGIFNGETGFVKEVIKLSDRIRFIVSYDVGYVFYDSNIEDIDLAYALTIHKAQGAQWDKVLVLASSKHMYMLSNNLLYTAITRAKKECQVIGNSSSIEYAIRNKKENKRLTSLDKRLIELAR